MNPSELLIKALAAHYTALDLKTVILPVSFQRAFQELEKAIEEHSPQVVIATGLAVGRKELTIERVAINHRQAEMADNDGVWAHGEAIVQSGPDGVFSGLPLEAMVQASVAAGVPASISNTAGTYVCNDLMYKLVGHSRQNGYRAGFLHLPEGAMENVLPGVVAMLRALGNH